MIDRLASYSAASTMPTKLLQHSDAIIGGKIRPLHLQLNPTNRCNIKCAFCSCSERDRTRALPLQEIEEIFYIFASMGTRSVTITGGGEPLMHPDINAIIEAARQVNIQVGLVTNGMLLDRLQSDWPTWVRLSVADERPINDSLLNIFVPACRRMPSIDWNFSYVVGRTPNIKQIKMLATFAAKYKFTHMRLVSDLLDIDSVPDMENLRKQLTDCDGEDLIIYQGRKEYTPGCRRCLISLLKPGIGADGSVYACCGVQYAEAVPGRDYPLSMTMGHWREFPRRIALQEHFDGTICQRCYYGQYNQLLAAMTSIMTHEDFV